MLLAWMVLLAAGAPGPAVDGAPIAARLAAGEPLRIVFLGDSITAGYDLDQPAADAYPALFCRLLETAFGIRTVSVVRGLPGSPTDRGLELFAAEVEPEAPHLVLLQFGGNDKGTGEGLAYLDGYRRNLRELVARCRALGAAPLILAPPMHEPVLGMPFPTAALETAAALGVPAADLDTALKRPPLDYRGIFPYTFHPREHEHARMAFEIYRAFGELIGRSPAVEVELVRGAAPARPGVPLPWTARLRNLTAIAQPVDLTIDTALPRLGAPPPSRAVELPPRGEVTVAVELLLPHLLPGGRSAEYPLRLVARTPDAPPAFDLARLTLVPQIAAPRPAADLAPLAELGGANLLETTFWNGPDDLSAALFLTADATTLRLTVDVRDDIYQYGRGVPLGDGIELFWDLRPDGERGQPFATPLCATLFVTATAPPEAPAVRTLEADRPPAGLLALRPTCTNRRDGYAIALEVPRALLDQAAGRRVDRLGFDLAVDDQDGTTRDSQLLWLGRPDNFLNPRRLAELWLDAAPPEPWRATVY